MTTSTLLRATPGDRSPYANMTLWTFQGWLAMFFIAAGYAKLTEPMNNLVNLLGWPQVVPPNFVAGVGIVEIVLALAMLSPLVSWHLFRHVLLTSAVGLLILQVTMLAVHALSRDFGLAAVNLILIGLTVSVFIGRRRG